MASNENLPPNIIKQLAKELKVLHETPPEGIKVVVNYDDFSTIYADIEGPAGTPYENGIFRMKLLLSREFPQSPPKGYFLTKIFHPNIATNGEICVNTLKKDWNPGLGLRHVLLFSEPIGLLPDFSPMLKSWQVVRCLLIEPFPESALNEQAGKMLLEDYDEYARHARLYTGIHALKPKSKSKSGPISESTTALNVPPTLLGASIDSKRALVNNHDHQSTAALASASSEPAVSASAAGIVPKKVVAAASGATKFPVDKKKMDARKKSLKRL